MSIPVERLARNEKSAAVAVLVSAFHDYPVMRYISGNSGEQYEKDLVEIIDFFCEIRFLRNAPVLGVRQDGRLVAVALVNELAEEPPPLPFERLQQLRAAIGEPAYERLLKYEDKSSGPEPKDPHHFLGMIGVLPSHRGKGYAKILLDAVREMAVRDPRSTGVCLSTEDSVNVPLYERFGYRVIAEVDIDEVHSWCMFLNTR